MITWNSDGPTYVRDKSTPKYQTDAYIKTVNTIYQMAMMYNEKIFGKEGKAAHYGDFLDWDLRISRWGVKDSNPKNCINVSYFGNGIGMEVVKDGKWIAVFSVNDSYIPDGNGKDNIFKLSYCQSFALEGAELLVDMAKEWNRRTGGTIS